MKTLSTILALLILSLTVMPCNDGFAMDNCGTEVHYHNAADQNQNNHSDSDFCSPFCNCCCCHTHIMSHVQKTYHIVLVTTDNPNTYSQNFTSTLNFSIWHPPKF